MQILLNGFTVRQPNTSFKAKKQAISTGKKLTEAQIKKNRRNNHIMKMLGEGLSKSEIAQKLHISISTITNLIKTKTSSLIKDDFIQGIIERIERGETLEYIAQQEGLTKNKVSRIAKEANLKVVTEYQKNKVERDKLICEKLMNGESPEKIAEEFKISISLVSNIAKLNKIQGLKKKDKILRVIDKVKKNFSVEGILEEENISLNTMRRYLKKASRITHPIIRERKNRNLRIVKDYKLGKNIEQIAIDENLSSASVKRILQDSKEEFISEPKKRRNSLETQILGLLQKGFSRKEVAEKLNINNSRVVKVAEKYNIFQNQIAQRTERIVEKLKNGYSSKQIAEEEGVNITTVIRAYQKAGIKPISNTSKPLKKEVIKEELLKGTRVSDIVRKHNVSEGYVILLKRELGLTKKYNYRPKPQEFSFKEIKEQSKNITKLRDNYRKFKLGERNPEILDKMLEVIEILTKKLEEFKSRAKYSIEP